MIYHNFVSYFTGYCAYTHYVKWSVFMLYCWAFNTKAIYQFFGKNISICQRNSHKQLVYFVSEHMVHKWLCGRVPDLQSGGCGFESQPGLLCTKVYSVFHPSGVGKWVPVIAGKAKAGMAHSDCGWTCGCAGKTEIPWEHVTYLSASAVVIHYQEALYQVYAPLPYLPLHGINI